MMDINSKDDTLPADYKVLPYSVDFRIPNFTRCYTSGDRCLALAPVDTTDWFNGFIDIVASAIGRRYLPICRMSDGEFLFLLGSQPADLRHSRIRRWVGVLRRRIESLRAGKNFEAKTAGHYHSGRYTRVEQSIANQRYAQQLRAVSERGILALHLTYGRRPFQEACFPALRAWLDTNGIVLTTSNYVPFYFVYAALTGPRRGEWLHGRRVLVVNGAAPAKQRQIVEGLRREGVASVEWLPISADRSLFDTIDVSEWRGRVDVTLVGAGIGKPNILCQLETLNVPCIDAGFVFEVWADPRSRFERPFCAPDRA